MRFSVLFLFLFISDLCQSQVATAPSSPAQRLINPAATAFREFSGIALDAGRQSDVEKVLGLKDASIGIKTKIDTLNLNAPFSTGKVFWEISVSPQKGTKETSSLRQTGSGPNSNFSSSDLMIVPSQLIVASTAGSNLGLGLKLMYTNFRFEDATQLSVATETFSEEISENKSLDGSFLVAAPGLIYNFGDSGFSLALVAEFIQLKNSQNVVGSNERIAFQNVGVSESFNIDTKSNDTINARKDIVALGYFKKFAGTDTLRLEASFEKMPPLTKVKGYPAGEVYRITGEVNFWHFRLGAETNRRSGYNVDPYNLIPYFFRIDHLGLDPVQETSVFGGLKIAKGHGFGASYSQSKGTTSRRLAVGGTAQEVQKESTLFNVSYTYVF